MPLQSLIFNESGGLSYHLRAQRYRDRLWSPFTQELKKWLTDWSVMIRLHDAHPSGGSELVVVGASAGYCWLDTWILGFERLEIYEPDPLARALLRRRLRKLGYSPSQIRFGDVNALTAAAESEVSGALTKFLVPARRAVLFTNILGQLVFTTDECRLNRWKNQIQELTQQSVFWASFHDRVSGTLPLKANTWPRSFDRRLDDAQVATLFEPREKAELLDHETSGFFSSELRHSYFDWKLTPRRHHLIEAVMGL